MILPRRRCVVRHRAESGGAENSSDLILDIVFDVGVVFSADGVHSAREARLREDLKHNPMDALAAANLGGLLLQAGNLAEAEKWLKHALVEVIRCLMAVAVCAWNCGKSRGGCAKKGHGHDALPNPARRPRLANI